MHETDLTTETASATRAEKIISKLVAKALYDYHMIEDGDRILIAASGGKDSTTVLYDLARKKHYRQIRCDLHAIHISTEFSAPTIKPQLEEFCTEWEIPFHTREISVQGRLKPGRNMNCYWCSTQRRTELIRFARAEGFQKIVLGHHMDDIVETLFMNMLQKAEISTMTPVMHYNKYPVTIIRPLALVEERQIIEFVREKGFDRSVCTCGYGTKSYRKEVRSRIEAMTGGSSQLKRNIFNSMKNVRTEYLG